MFPQLGLLEMAMVMGVAVLLFGKRLPEVGRSLGKGIIEFKKGLRGLEEGFDFGSDAPSTSRRGSSSGDDRPRASSPSPAADSVPKFEPPALPQVPQMEYQPQATPQD